MSERKATRSARTDASHEAAHAVVAVRLGLRILHATIRRSELHPDDLKRIGRDGISLGQVVLDPPAFPTVEAGQPLDALAREAHERLAVQIAAGLLVEHRLYGQRSMTEGGATDMGALVETANILGIISVPVGSVADLAEWPAFQPWLNRCVDQAEALLDQDDGAAWDRVRVALERKRYLTGKEVEALVAESDASSGDSKRSRVRGGR